LGKGCLGAGLHMPISVRLAALVSPDDGFAFTIWFIF
jgi:hypothetical protein